MNETLILAHYYTIPEVQQIADYVGDSLDLALHAVKEKPKRIVFAGVRFMAETAKILNPDAEVVLPDYSASCSLVEQTNMRELINWRQRHFTSVHVTYINSSAHHKVTSDIVVTSRIVEDVIGELFKMGKKVIFSPDRNMGEYLNYTNGYDMPVWKAVCEVHDKFKGEELEKLLNDVSEPKFVLAHPESPLPVLLKADYVGSTHGMLKWIKDHEGEGTVFVATEEGLLYNMRKLRPDLDIRQAPTYTGCQCNQCPYMKKNTVDLVRQTIKGNAGTKIEYLGGKLMDAARKPIQRMLDYVETNEIRFN